jgi:CRISPR/Cas system CSM-associated protein Csm2 small subunit
MTAPPYGAQIARYHGPVPEDRVEVAVDDVVSELGLIADPEPSRMTPVRAEQPSHDVVVERASLEERMIYALEERLAEIELRLRQQFEVEHQQQLEMRALERDLLMKEAYVGYLEHDRGALHARLVEAIALRDEVISHRDEIFRSLEAREAELAEAQASLAAINQQLAYRVSRKATRVLKENTGPLYGVLRAAMRAVAR